MAQKIKIVTHSGKFHTDDVFAVATLQHVFEDTEVIRTRDDAAVRSGDVVVDVGNVYSVSQKRFDHHQPEGAGVRKNGIPYASFGLVWEVYGEEICGDKEIAKSIDQVLVQPIDAGDNGVDLCTSCFSRVFPYTVGSIVDLFRPTHTEGEDYDAAFVRAVEWAKWVIIREVEITQDALAGKSLVESFYREAPDKQVVVFDKTNALGRELTTSFLIKYPEVLYAVLYRKDIDSWQVVALNESEGTYRVRKPLPESWAGKGESELQKVTGVTDAIFCHKGRFMAVTKSKEGALKLAQLALDA